MVRAASAFFAWSLIALPTIVWAQAPAPEGPGTRQPPPPVPAGQSARSEQGENAGSAEPLVHGPVHEAFAAPTPRDAAFPPKVARLPPNAPQELPPAVGPEQPGSVARWIPGYWGWDARKQGYVWVSGTWRNAPPEMEWVPGYWAADGEECRWVAGFWAYRGAEELAYLPPPPAPKNELPPPQPGEGYFWVPGAWQYVETTYRWKPGFWAEAREDWVWTPDTYAWTPRGFIFVRGYWDQPLERRGTLFAPLALQEAAQRISPTVAIDVREALVHWFVGPAYRHYYFGDYYEAGRGQAQLTSWYDTGPSGPYYDSMLAYYSANNAAFFSTLKAKHKQAVVNVAARPTLAWRDYRGAGTGALAFALSGDSLATGFTRVDFASQEVAAVTSHYRTVLDRRAQFERGVIVGEGQAPVFVGLDSIVPRGHGGLPPGLAKKGLVPPGFGGLPPGQTRKVVESFGPIVGKPPKEKFGEGGKGNGKGKGKGKGR